MVDFMMDRFMIFTILWMGLIHSVHALTFTTVVIDAGHGGKDGGCVWNGLVEKKICLDTA